MKNGIKLLTLISIYLVFTSCKDEEPPKSKLGFEVTELEVFESNGTLESFHPLMGVNGSVGREVDIAIKLDRPVSETSVIQFSLSGTAKKNSTANIYGDYDIKGNGENITINKGESTAKITVILYEDLFLFEDGSNQGITENADSDAAGRPYETIVIDLESVVSGPAVLGDNSSFTLKIFEDDGLVFLDWEAPSASDSADMDLFFHNSDGIVFDFSSYNSSFEAPEIALVPGGFPAGRYDLSYTYYEGNRSSLKFGVGFYNFGGKINNGTYSDLGHDPLFFEQTYSLNNLNRWDDVNNDSGDYKGDPVKVQSLNKTGLDWTVQASITKPATGSRLKALDSKYNKLTPTRIKPEQIEMILSRLGWPTN